MNLKQIITNEELNNALKNPLVVLKFSAQWCGPCKRMEPIVADVSSRNPDILFFEVDIDKAQSIAAQYNINSVPTLIFIKNGAIINTIIGGLGVEKLVEALSHLKMHN